MSIDPNQYLLTAPSKLAADFRPVVTFQKPFLPRWDSVKDLLENNA